MRDSTDVFFSELVADIRHQEQAVGDMIRQQLDLHCPDRELRAAVEDKRETFAQMVSEIVRNSLIRHDLATMAALDGATAMADKTTVTIIDQDGEPWPEALHLRFTGYLMDQELW